MLKEITNNNDMKKIIPFFYDIRFFMGKSVLDGTMGTAYVDNITNPNIAFLVVRSYCFFNGKIEKESLKEIIDEKFKEYNLIPSDNLSKLIEEIYKSNIIKSQRHSIKKDVIFDTEKLKKMSNSLEDEFELIKINDDLAKRIKEEKFINITDNYSKNGIGFCCMYNNKIVGVASSNIFYKDGIEVNIKTKEQYQRKGIATAMASKLILECLKQNKKVSWDAANMESVGLAEKLGFKYDSTYNVYRIS